MTNEPEKWGKEANLREIAARMKNLDAPKAPDDSRLKEIVASEKAKKILGQEVDRYGEPIPSLTKEERDQVYRGFRGTKVVDGYDKDGKAKFHFTSDGHLGERSRIARVWGGTKPVTEANYVQQYPSWDELRFGVKAFDQRHGR